MVSEIIFDVSADEFEDKVIAASAERVVVVDFWAPWCGPCRTLGPTLEKVVKSFNGKLALAKVNVDENQPLAARYGVQGIPAVKIFRDGQVVAEFVGALPEAEIRRQLEAVAPSEVDELVAQATQAEPAQAEDLFQKALAVDANHAGACVGLAGLLLQRGDFAEARELAAKVEAGAPEYAVAEIILGHIFFIEACARAGGPQAIADDADLNAVYDWACCLAAQNKSAEALEALLGIIRADKTWRDGAAKEAMVRIFTILGQQNPLTGEYRGRLASALY